MHTHAQLAALERENRSQCREMALTSGKPLSLLPELPTAKVSTFILPEKSLPPSLGLDFSLYKVFFFFFYPEQMIIIMKKIARVNFGLTFYVGLVLKYLETQINWSPAYHLQREAEVWDMSKIRQFKISSEQHIFLDGRGRLQYHAHPNGTASHTRRLTPRGRYLRRGWLDSHRLGRPSRWRRLGLDLLLDSVVVRHPAVHLGLGLHSPESRRVSAPRCGGVQKAASPARAPRVSESL